MGRWRFPPRRRHCRRCRPPPDCLSPARCTMQSQLAAVAAVWSGGPDSARPLLLPRLPLAGQPLWHRRHPAAGAVLLSWVLHGCDVVGALQGDLPRGPDSRQTVPKTRCMPNPCRQWLRLWRGR
jgi:hypothetical protein